MCWRSANPSNTLYPGLEDHNLVFDYPDVVGMDKNVFFLSVMSSNLANRRNHTHAEKSCGDSGSSKRNPYEVSWNRRSVIDARLPWLATWPCIYSSKAAILEREILSSL